MILISPFSTAEKFCSASSKSLKGSFKMPKDMDYKKELRNRLEEKYL